jgi:cyclophilin family peptidyl-prolyl cis-trans isomerase
LRRESLAAQARAKPPFPVSLLFNVRLFYVIALIAIVGSVGLAAVMSGTMRRGSTQSAVTPTPTAVEQTAEASPEPTPLQVKTYPNPPEMTIDTSKQYSAVIKTKKGDISLELFADEAPQTVNNFVFLARDGFYDGLIFYFVDPELVAQAGDPTCTTNAAVTCSGEDGPGYTLPKETNDKEHVAGSVAMAEDTETYTTNGSQFFIALQDLPRLGEHNTVFGQVADEDSMNVVRSLTVRQWRDPNAPPGDEILSVTIEESE